MNIMKLINVEWVGSYLVKQNDFEHEIKVTDGMQHVC